MVARIIPNIGSYTVETLSGDEYISFRSGSQGDKQITAANLRHYFGGDIAAPVIRAERGIHATAVSEFPNAEFPMREGDVLTGLQNGVNVNFSRAQILAPLAELVEVLVAEALARSRVKE